MTEFPAMVSSVVLPIGEAVTMISSVRTSCADAGAQIPANVASATLQQQACLKDMNFPVSDQIV